MPNKLITSQLFLSSGIIPTKSKEKESDELLYTVTRYGPRTSRQRMALTSCTGMTCHSRRELFRLKLQHFLSFRYIRVKRETKQAKRMTSLLPLNNVYPVMSHRRVQKKQKATSYCTGFGHSLRSANQLPAQIVKSIEL